MEAESEINGLVKKFGRVSVSDSLASFQEYQVLAARLSASREAVIDLAGADDSETIGAGIRSLSLELRAERERLLELMPYKIEDPVEYASLERDLARKEDEFKGLIAAKARAEARMAEAEFDPDELAGLEEEEAENQARLAFWERQLRVHDKALQVMEQAARAVMEKAGDMHPQAGGDHTTGGTRPKFEHYAVSCPSRRYSLY